MKARAMRLGAIPLGGGRVSFRVWAPKAEQVEVVFVGDAQRRVPLVAEERGYFAGVVDGVPPEADYVYRLDDRVERPDPASRWQPHGVHAASRVVDGEYEWGDTEWSGCSLREAVIYELHVGTFTGAGTLDAAIGELEALKELGITAVELMPLAQFPGERNWGYDGTYPFAVQSSYGGPAALKRFVEAAHLLGLGVVLDVVYNHLGPEGNYLGEFGPYFTDRYRTPWGEALNFDGPDSDAVRCFFIENALYWQTECHVDALRLDAVHAIRDFSAVPFLEELGEAARRQSEALGRPFYLIAESDMNMARHILPRELGGYGLDAQWSDDFHHALHVLLTDEREGYYADFGRLGQFAKVWREGYAFTGQYSAYRRYRHGSSPRHNPVKQFVVCAQNHDQVGNRFSGDRLSATLSADQLRLAAAATLLSPFIPLLFMGEEYGETAPFQYFVSHGDSDLVEAVRRGRREEFAAFAWKGEVPDPQAEETFSRCRLNRLLLERSEHRRLREFYLSCLRLRRESEALAGVEKETQEVSVWDKERVMMARAWCEEEEVVVLLHFGAGPAEVRLGLEETEKPGGEAAVPFSLKGDSGEGGRPAAGARRGHEEGGPPTPVRGCDERGSWEVLLNSSDAKWSGSSSGSVESGMKAAAGGGVEVTLAGWSAMVLCRRGRERLV